MKLVFSVIIQISVILCGLAQSSAPYTEVKLYNNLYSQTSNFDASATRFDDIVRQSFITNIIELNFHNPTKRTWWGIDAYVRASRKSPTDESPFKVLNYESNGQNAQTSFSHIGPKLYWKPNAENDNLALKFLLLIPVDGQSSTFNSNIPSLDNSGFQLWSQINYNAKLAEGLYGYGELSLVARLGRDAMPESDFFIPMEVFLSYFVHSGIGLFGYLDYTPTVSSPTSFYFQSGGGVKIFPSKDWEIELSAGKFLAGKSSGAGYSINLGLTHQFRTPEQIK